MQEEEKEGDGEEEGLMEGALARYIVTRWSTPCIELVCEFLFLKKTNLILYSQSLIPTPTCWQTSKRNSKRNLRFTKLHSFIQFRLILFRPNWGSTKITGLINKGETRKIRQQCQNMPHQHQYHYHRRDRHHHHNS